jgi:hypothetical protein
MSSFYFQKDRDMLSEAYKQIHQKQLLTESPPTESGENFEKDIPHTEINPDTTKYMKQIPEGELRGKTAYVVIKKVKEFLKSQPDCIFPGDFKAFRDEVANIIRKEFPNIDKANAGYTARKIQEVLTSAEILKDERNGKLRVSKAAALVSAEDIEAKFKEVSGKSETEIPKTETEPKSENVSSTLRDAGAPKIAGGSKVAKKFSRKKI